MSSETETKNPQEMIKLQLQLLRQVINLSAKLAEVDHRFAQWHETFSNAHRLVTEFHYVPFRLDVELTDYGFTIRRIIIPPTMEIDVGGVLLEQLTTETLTREVMNGVVKQIRFFLVEVCNYIMHEEKDKVTTIVDAFNKLVDILKTLKNQ